MSSRMPEPRETHAAIDARRDARGGGRRDDPMWQAGWREGISTVWRHMRWFEPHEAVPVPGSEVPFVRATRMSGAECATCGEGLNGWHRASPVLPTRDAAPSDPATDTGGEGQ